jgi:hypothetical protein
MTDGGKALASRAKAVRDEGRMEAALDLYARAAVHARREGDALALAHRLRHIGDIHQDAGHDAEAAPFYAEALAVYRDNPATPALDLANLLRPMTMLKEKAGVPADAAALWAEAKTLYEVAGVEEGARESGRRLARLA